MRDTTIARNYAEVLVTLAQRAGDLDGWGRMIDDVGQLVEKDLRVRRFLESPRVPVAAKKEILTKAFQDKLPHLMVRFLEALLQNRRQLLVPVIASEYASLVDESLGRVRAEVTLAREPEPGEVEAIAASLSKTLGRTAVAHVRVNPDIIGGVIVRVGDFVKDGSVRRRLGVLKSKLVQQAR
ncbi:MAG: ATP synthase F1 subunit delta [Gemmatimonadaceae bacterium]|nr:ATP synthase F1 subunit delta [Gemmatimonadaceae bacterium]